MKKLLLAILLAAFAFSGKAHDIELDGFYFSITSLTDLTVALTCNENDFVEEEFGKYYKGNSYSGDIVVPEKVTWNNRTFVVNEIFGHAFNNCTLTSLVIPPSIQYMHLGNAKITKLVIEDSDEELTNSSPFYIGLSEGQIEELYIGRNINEEDCFEDLSIKSVTFGEKVTYITDDMFYGCNITGTLVLPNNIKEIGRYAFAESNITSVNAMGLEVMGERAFSYCSSLKAIDAPNLKYINNEAFSNCTSLTSYEIPQGVANIESGAFSYCTGLESVIIPNSIIEFGGNIFSGCTSLKSITVNATTPFMLEESNFDAQTYINAALHVPSSSLDAYKNADVWKNFFNISGDNDIEDNVCSIMFKGCSEYSYDGFVEIGNLQIKDDEYIMSANKGDKITLKFIPNSNDEHEYELGKVTINGEDVTFNVMNDELTVEVIGNMIIDIEWDYVESDPVLLTIKQAENGCTKMVVDEWETYKFFIEPSEGWTLHSVALNGEDITNRVGDDGALKLSEISESTTLSITFESNGSSVKSIVPSRAKVYGVDNSIVISGANDGENIQIYDDAGLLIETVKATSDSMRIPLVNGIYIVKLDGKAVKVAI